MNEIIPLGMNKNPVELPKEPADQLPDPQAVDPGLDEQDILANFMYDFKNDIRDKEDFGWLFKRQYDVRAYYGIKNSAMQNWPYPGASAYPVPITPTLLDTGWANIRASMEGIDGKLVRVRGVGKEDIRKARILENLLNWQVTNDDDIDAVEDADVFRTLLHGNGITKVIQDFVRNMVKMFSFDIENFFVPIDAGGLQVGDTDHVIQIIPLSYADIQQRKLWGIYKNLDRIRPGVGIATAQATDLLTREKDIATGTNLEQRFRRETFFVAEYYKTFYPKSGSASGGPTRAAVRPQEIIAWISPNGGTSHRIVKNLDRIRPFADTAIYPNAGRFFAMSMPEKLRNIQEKADYADKQYTDALDRAIMPAGFVDDSEVFNPGSSMRVPGGIYPLGSRGQKISWEPQPALDRGFSLQYQQMWVEAQQITGLIDISYGSNATRDKTLGQTQIRSSRADIRFSSIFDRVERGWKKKIDLYYHYNARFMPRDKIVKVLGYADIDKIAEIFPQGQDALDQGFQGRFDFQFGGAAITDQDQENQRTIQLCANLLMNPLTIQNPGNLWRVTEKLAQAYGERNLEAYITKPKEAYLTSPEEAIERIVSGQVDFQPRPGIDTDSYIFEIGLFMRSDSYQGVPPEVQQALQKLLQICYVMRSAEMLAQHDIMKMSQGMMAQNAPQMPGDQGMPTPQPGIPGNQGVNNGQRQILQ